MSTELMAAQEAGLARNAENVSTSPMRLLQIAVERGADIGTIERLAKLQSEMLAYEAEIAFNDAMTRAQGQMSRISADALNPQTKSRYATYAKLDGVLRPIYHKEGFALSFNTDPLEGDVLRVVCYVTKAGHTRKYQIDMPADGKGAKGGDVMTKTHATGAAASYGMRYLLKMIFNVAVGENDDDGNGATQPNKKIPEPELVALITNIQACQTKKDTVSIFQAAYTHVSTVYGDKEAMAELIEVKNVHKEECAS